MDGSAVSILIQVTVLCKSFVCHNHHESVTFALSYSIYLTYAHAVTEDGALTDRRTLGELSLGRGRGKRVLRTEVLPTTLLTRRTHRDTHVFTCEGTHKNIPHRGSLGIS